MSKLLIVSDAWHPQINGVVRSLDMTAEELRKMGLEVDFLTPQSFRTVPCPTYPEIPLSITTPGRVRRMIADSHADYIHLATEGPLGQMGKRAAHKLGLAYTTSYHTRFPEYVSARFPIPERWMYAWMRRFHNGGIACMVATHSLEDDLRARGFNNLCRWSRGVDHMVFKPSDARLFDHLPGPIFLHIGRIAVEKNIEAFLKLDLPGSKVVVGDGPQLASLKAAYPNVLFTGAKQGDELARHYASGDVFVFPSLTDTFGNVLLEAIACGVPVAAYPVTGPQDVIGDTGAGVIDEDLGKAALSALDISRTHCRDVALGFSWEASARQFLKNVSVGKRPAAVNNA
ncbi:MAG: glycosyltransferase family 1 protein [Stappiaceae bacterium]